VRHLVGWSITATALYFVADPFVGFIMDLRTPAVGIH
jgi:hypothetical protein